MKIQIKSQIQKRLEEGTMKLERETISLGKRVVPLTKSDRKIIGRKYDRDYDERE